MKPLSKYETINHKAVSIKLGAFILHQRSDYMITVCKDCPKRHVGCHGYCTLYKTEHKLLDKENARKRAESAAYDSVSNAWNYDDRGIRK